MRRGGAALAFLVIFPSWVMAAEGEPAGAFGLDFGQTLDISQLTPLENDTEGGLQFGFTPANPYGPLNEYVVTVTPRSHRVYQITGSGMFNSMKRCREELVRLEEALSHKYVKTSGKISEYFGDIPEITFGRTARKVRGVCLGTFVKKRLVLTYTDQELERAALAEVGAATPGVPSAETGQGRDESGL